MDLLSRSRTVIASKISPFCIVDLSVLGSPNNSEYSPFDLSNVDDLTWINRAPLITWMAVAFTEEVT